MPVQTSDLMTFAEGLLSLPSEAAWRAAISRSYYAVYHRALKWEEEQHINGSNIGRLGGAHQQLMNRLRNPSIALPTELRRRSALLATKLEIQRDRRVDADYWLQKDIAIELATMQLEQAKEAINEHCGKPRCNPSA